MAAVVLGLDLSLTKTGMAAVPADWAHDFNRCAVATAGMGLKKDATEHERAMRLKLIRDAVLQFARRVGAGVAIIEQYAYTSMVTQAHSLGELGGVVRLALIEAGIEVEVVAPASARKLLGKQPRKDAKIWAAHRLVTMGAPAAWPMDCLDAFAVCNFKLAELGVGLLAPAAA